MPKTRLHPPARPVERSGGPILMRDVAARTGATAPSQLLGRLDAMDRAWYLHWVIRGSASRATAFLWTRFSDLGGVTASVAFALVPLLVADGPRTVVAIQAAWTLSLSLLTVQAIKRLVVRARPAEQAHSNVRVRVPDQFSFPSGHAASSMSLAFIYAASFHDFALPLLALAALIGASRVRLGVHYPGDVVAGQLIAIATGVAVRALW